MLNKAGTVLVSWVKETIDRHGYGEWDELDPKTENRKKRKTRPLLTRWNFTIPLITKS